MSERLLTDEERMNVDIPCEAKCLCTMPKFDPECVDCMVICHEKAQLAKDMEWEDKRGFIKDAEYQAKIEEYRKANKDFQDLLIEAHKQEQARVERIKRVLERKMKKGSFQSGTYHFYSILVEQWQEFWKQEGIK